MYYTDFKILQNGKYRIVEVKGNHYWHKRDLQSGKFLSKVKSAQIYGNRSGFCHIKY